MNLIEKEEHLFTYIVNRIGYQQARKVTNLGHKFNELQKKEAFTRKRMKATLHKMKGKLQVEPSEKYSSKHSKTIFYA